MAKFIFRLQGLLNIKVQLEEQKKLELAEAMRGLAAEKEALRAIEAGLEEVKDSFRRSKGKSLYPQELKRMGEGIKYYEDAAKVQRTRIEKAEKNVQVCRAKLNQAIIERKTYEKLKEIEFEGFLRTLQEQENKQLDEIVSFKYSR